MEPRERLDYWNKHNNPTDFVEAIHGWKPPPIHFLPLGRSWKDFAAHNPLRKERVLQVYEKIHNYIQNNQLFLNAGDAERVELLAKRVAALEEHTSFEDTKLEELRFLANKLRNLQPPDGQLGKFLPFPSELTTLVEEYYVPFEDLIELLAGGRSVDPMLIEQISNPSIELLHPFIKKINRLCPSEGSKIIGSDFIHEDAAVANIRTFCSLARKKRNAEEWLILAITCLDLDSLQDAHKLSNIDLMAISNARWMLKFAPPKASEIEYQAAICKLKDKFTDLTQLGTTDFTFFLHPIILAMDYALLRCKQRNKTV